MSSGIQCGLFYDWLVGHGIDFFVGVPDSLLKDFCGYVHERTSFDAHVIAANEGGAIALASGYHLATGRAALVYMQNSGQGNAVNPLTSLADPEVYSVPMLLLIGWRGEPGVPDEPQHRKQGLVTLALLESIDVPYAVLPDSHEGAQTCLDAAVRTLKERSCPYALVVRKGTFAASSSATPEPVEYSLTREDAVKAIVDALGPDDVIVSTTGKTSRELFEYREAKGHGHGRDFLTVGSMGHASQIALGIALSRPEQTVYCLDGDGAVIMHMGALAIVGSQAPRNFRHLVVNNGVHDSVGGQPTAGFDIDIPAIALACGYKSARRADTRAAVSDEIASLRAQDGPTLLEIRARPGARTELGRPTTTPHENKSAFMNYLN
jgi:phosphonopyruvate decarboxylase